jgi:hypothetical protein
MSTGLVGEVGPQLHSWLGGLTSHDRLHLGSLVADSFMTFDLDVAIPFASSGDRWPWPGVVAMYLLPPSRPRRW